MVTAKDILAALSKKTADLKRRELRKLVSLERVDFPSTWEALISLCAERKQSFTALRDLIHPDVLFALLATAVMDREATGDAPRVGPEHVARAFRDEHFAMPDKSKRSRAWIMGYPNHLDDRAIESMMKAIIKIADTGTETADDEALEVKVTESGDATTGRYFRISLADTGGVRAIVYAAHDGTIARKFTGDGSRMTTAIKSIIDNFASLVREYDTRIAGGVEEPGRVLGDLRTRHGDKAVTALSNFLEARDSSAGKVSVPPPETVSSASASATAEAEKNADAERIAEAVRTRTRRPDRAAAADTPLWNPAFTQAVNKLLDSGSSGKITDVRELLAMQVKYDTATAAHADAFETWRGTTASLEATIKELRTKLATAGTYRPKATAPIVLDAASIPASTIAYKKASEVFGINDKRLDFGVPTFTWDGENPLVPEADKAYEFQIDKLAVLLYGLIHNAPIWMWGHTGSGKTTFYEQVAARLNWMTGRINFDSDIDRMSLVGRDVLRVEDGATKSTFVHGPLPTFMKMPTMLILDELDSARPDCTYVMQRVTESNGLLIAENGGEFIMPHEMFRICGTANTSGHGDEMNIYPSVRPQSQAFLNRFLVKLRIDYLTREKEALVIAARVPSIEEETASRIAHFMSEARFAFMQGRTLQAFSPRDAIALASTFIFFGDMRLALEATVFGGCSAMDRAALEEIAASTLGSDL